MATMVQTGSVTTSRLKEGAVIDVQEIPNGARPALLILHNEGEEDIVGIFADVLGQKWESATSMDEALAGPRETVYGLSSGLAKTQLDAWDRSRLLINTHRVDGGHELDESITDRCDYEYLYTRAPFFRRDVSRYLSFVLGQIGPHRDLTKKARTTLISTTFPDVHAALPNLDILSVGADAIEIRVDLLEEPLPDGTVSKIPSLKYVGEQVMVLRQRTELPIIFTTRCTKENGRFPMDDPSLLPSTDTLRARYNGVANTLMWNCGCQRRLGGSWPRTRRAPRSSRRSTTFRAASSGPRLKHSACSRWERCMGTLSRCTHWSIRCRRTTSWNISGRLFKPSILILPSLASIWAPWASYQGR